MIDVTKALDWKKRKSDFPSLKFDIIDNDFETKLAKLYFYSLPLINRTQDNASGYLQNDFVS